MHSQHIRKWFSEKESKSSSTLGVPNSGYSIDFVDSPTSNDWTLVDIKQKSVSPPPTSPQAVHSRTGSFDLHSIEPPSSMNSKSPPPTPKKTLRSVSAQPEFDSDTTPLVEHSDTKQQHSSYLQRRGAIKRSSTKNQQHLSNSAGRGDKKLCGVSKSLSKSSTDLREIDAKSQKKPRVSKRSGYWISMMDGFQRILLFTPHYSVVQNCERENRLSFDVEVNFSLRCVTITLIDNNTNREVLILSVLP